MPIRTRPGVATQVYLDPAQRAKLEALAKSNQRSISVEIRDALDRYLESPNRIVHPPPPEPPPKRRRGRPRKIREEIPNGH
jgi:hypothetical protein